ARHPRVGQGGAHLPIYMLPAFLMVFYAGFSLFVAIFLLTMAYRFVKAHERISESLEKMTRPASPPRDLRP
ncbi:MAG TPA: hypothetical protein VGE76_05700, partial [Opitutaceae bacterium]